MWTEAGAWARTRAGTAGRAHWREPPRRFGAESRFGFMCVNRSFSDSHTLCVLWFVQVYCSGKKHLGKARFYEEQQDSRFTRCHNFFRMLRLISCMGGTGAPPTQGNRRRFCKVVWIADWLFCLAVEFMITFLRFSY